MKAFRVALLLLLLLLLVITPARVLPAVAANVTAGNALYRADFASGLTGWSVLGAGWRSTKNRVSFAGAGDGEILAPTTVNLQDFAVQARIERIGSVGNNPADGDRGYGIVVRSAGKAGSGVRGGFYYGSGLLDPQSGIAWKGTKMPGDDVALHDGANTFRLTVHGNRYTLSENGVVTVRQTIDGLATGVHAGIFSSGYRIRVTAFRVFSLAPSRAGPAHESTVLLRLASLNLQHADVPTGYRRYLGDYHTNKQIARDDGETVGDLVSQGRVISLDVGFIHLEKKAEPRYLEATIVDYNTLDEAKAGFSRAVPQELSLGQDFHQSIPGKFGLDDYLATYQITFHSTPYTVYDLLFHRATYSVVLSFYFPVGAVSQLDAINAVNTAGHAIDGRIRRAG